MERITFKECKKHCSCLASSLKALAKGYLLNDGFSTYDRKRLNDLYLSIPEKTRESDKLTDDDIPFVLESVKEWSGLMLEDSSFPAKLINLVSEVYKQEFYDSWEFCLDRKGGENKLHDYLYGCNTNCIDDPNPLAHRHGHQFHIRKDSLENGIELLEKNLDKCLETAKTFDDLISLFTEEGVPKREIKGMGAVAIYDACLRIAWKENKGLMPSKIYLHAGVKSGAEALYHISQTADIDWYTGDADPRKVADYTPVDPDKFPGLLSELKDDKLRAHHLENLLCCFHEPFFLIETALRVRKGEAQRLKPQKIRVNGPFGPQTRRYLKLLDLMGYKE